MCLEQNKDNYNGEVVSLGNTLEEVGSNLFDALREMDKMNIDIVYSEEFSTNGVGQAIMNTSRFPARGCRWPQTPGSRSERSTLVAATLTARMGPCPAGKRHADRQVLDYRAVDMRPGR